MKSTKKNSICWLFCSYRLECQWGPNNIQHEKSYYEEDNNQFFLISTGGPKESLVSFAEKTFTLQKTELSSSKVH